MIDPSTTVRIVAFDLDDTLAESKSALSPAMAQVITQLLAIRPVCVISGGRFEQFQSQLLANLPPDANYEDLHLMPTCGTRYLRFYDAMWHEIYAQDLSNEEKQSAIAALESCAKHTDLWEPDSKVKGARIEDRGSQITYSALGQEAAVADKKAWDPDGSKRERLRAEVAQRLPELEVRAGGSTSIDVTRRNIDKAYGMKNLADHMGIDLSEIFFIGDRLMPGGNDYPVKELGIPFHQVDGPAQTEEYVRQLIEQLTAAEETK